MSRMTSQNTIQPAQASSDLISRYKGHEPAWLDKILFSLLFRAKRTRAADPVKDRELIETVIKLCDKGGMKLPKRIQISETYIPNAAYSPITNSLTVTSDILEALPKNQAEALIGHELGHYRKRWRDLTAAAIFLVAGNTLFRKAHRYLVDRTAKWDNLASKTVRNGPVILYGSLFFSCILPFSLYQRFIAEPGADNEAAALTSPKAAGDALEGLRERSREVWIKKKRGELPKTPIRDAIITLLHPIPDHPPMDQRIAKMRRLERREATHTEQLLAETPYLKDRKR